MTVLAVGDPGRQAAGRAIRRTLACAFLFSVTAGPAKEIPVLYDHAPWLNDPYDTAVSFAMFFVPLLTLGCAIRVLLAAFPLREPDAEADTTDWLGDIVAVAVRGGTRLGPFGNIVLTAVWWTDRNLVAAVRRHTVRSAALIAAGFGVTVGVSQSLREGYFASTAVLVVILLACGMYPLLMAAGKYLGVARSGRHLAGARRRAADASVLACAGVLVIFAFRDSLWWIVGSRENLAGIPQLSLLLIIFAGPFLVLHDEPLWPRWSCGHGTMELL